MSPLSKEREDESNQERPRAIDDEGPIRESRSHAVADISTQPEPRDRADEPSDAHHQVFVHHLVQLSLVSVTRNFANNILRLVLRSLYGVLLDQTVGLRHPQDSQVLFYDIDLLCREPCSAE